MNSNIEINQSSHGQIITKIMNLIKTDRMRGLDPNDIDKLIMISGIVIRNSEIIP